MKPIVTLTFNPAIDESCEADAVHPIHEVRTSNERYEPGGGGLIVAHVIWELGGPSLALCLAGGATGAHRAKMLDQDIVATRRKSQTIWYRIAGPRIERLFGLLDEMYCKQAKTGKSA